MSGIHRLMSFWTVGIFQRVTGGRWLSDPGISTRSLAGVSIDSRQDVSGRAFFAVVGRHLNGHDFLQPAAEGGAVLLIVSDACRATRVLDHMHRQVGTGSKPAVLLVDDTIQALQDLARAYRDILAEHGTRVVAVTGSNGKTTTRHLIHTLLSSTIPGKDQPRKTGTQSPRSFNNHIGVPLTILGADLKDDFVVVEVGTNQPGEIATLSRIVRPDVAVITQIGSAHLEGLGNKAAVAAEKASILDYIPTGGAAVIPGDETLIASYVDHLSDDIKVVRFGEASHNDLRLTTCRSESAAVRFTVEMEAVADHAGPPIEKPVSGQEYRLPIPGRHNALNAMAAIAVAHQLDIDHAGIASGLAQVQPVDMRLNIRQVAGVKPPIVLINDAYNANPDSMAAALRVLAEYTLNAGLKRHVAILGDMAELGPHAKMAHQDLARGVNQINRDARASGSPSRGIHEVILIGTHCHAHSAAVLDHDCESTLRGVHAFNHWSACLPETVAALIDPGDVVLIKGSRSAGLERLIPTIEARYNHLG